MPYGFRWLDYAVAKFGRKWTLAMFAGATSFLATVLAFWIVARTSDATGRLVVDILRDYLLAAAGFTGIYTTGNTMVEKAHASTGRPDRPSGTVPPVEES
jgi:hypothetical protein